MADRYAMLEKIGEGTFGQVFRAKDVTTGRVYAAKKVRLRRAEDGLSPATLREMKALQHIDHPNVVHLTDVFPHGSNVVLVLEYVPFDLSRLLDLAPERLRESEAKCIALMLLHGIAAMHDNNILHRDLKPSNLLITRQGVLKIADFGLARVHAHGKAPAPAHEPYSHQVATRWYRAPELLFGARRYGTGVDMWAAGAIIAHVLAHAPPFPGDNDIDQLFRVIGILGTPSERAWPGLSELPDYSKIAFPDLAPQPLSAICPDASPGALDLLAGLLVYSPDTRLTAREAATQPWLFVDPPPCLPRELAARMPPPHPHPSAEAQLAPANETAGARPQGHPQSTVVFNEPLPSLPRFDAMLLSSVAAEDPRPGTGESVYNGGATVLPTRGLVVPWLRAL
mmetsp:Transcript_14381/g.43738  ORF Transcript_14381/g.43738 Transcript_14381/m.43738 type:complete len:396 (-) Transcript_14381:81-1268(-)